MIKREAEDYDDDDDDDVIKILLKKKCNYVDTETFLENPMKEFMLTDCFILQSLML